MNNPCSAKKRYDTEFEAIRAASIAGSHFQAPMVPYECENHWHIANELVQMRSKNRPFNRTYCEVCDVYMKPGRYRNHLTRIGHKRKERERNGA